MQEVHICEQCHHEHDGSYGSGRFCSKECARGFSSSNRSLESRQKTGRSVSKLHLHICPKCKSEFWNKGTSRNTWCQKCRDEKYEEQISKSPFKKVFQKKIHHFGKHHRQPCPICGAIDRDHCKNREICKHEQMFPRLIKYLGYDPNQLGSEKAYEEYERVRQCVYDLYWNKKMSIQQIADLTGYKSSSGSFAILLSKLIKFRSSKQAVKVAIETGRFKIPSDIKYHCQWHTTWFGARVYCRSSYEKDYCDELDAKKIQYSMESLAIQYYDSQLQKMRYAYPDFYLPDTNTIVEVKSSWTFDYQNMKDRIAKFLELGYNFDLLYEHKHYPNMTFFES